MKNPFQALVCFAWIQLLQTALIRLYYKYLDINTAFIDHWPLERQLNKQNTPQHSNTMFPAIMSIDLWRKLAIIHSKVTVWLPAENCITLSQQRCKAQGGLYQHVFQILTAIDA